MSAFLYVALACSFLQVQATPAEVQQLIQVITPGVADLRPGMAYRNKEARSSIKRLEAINKLGSMGAHASAAVPILTTLVGDPFEPRTFKYAEVKALQQIGTPAKSAVGALQQLMGSNDAWLSSAAESAILHIELRTQSEVQIAELNALIVFLGEFSRRHGDVLASLAKTYIRLPQGNARDKAFGGIEKILLRSKRPESIICDLLSQQISQQLGHRLLNSSKFDGRSLTVQMLVADRQPQCANLLLENLDSRESVARQILNDASLKSEVWGRVFRKYRLFVLGTAADQRQEKIQKMVAFVKSVSPILSPCRVIVLEAFSELWAASDDDFKPEIIETARSVVSTATDDQVLQFLQGALARGIGDELTRNHNIRFAVQLNAEQRLNVDESTRVEQLLTRLIERNAIDARAGARALLNLIRQQPPRENSTGVPVPMVESYLIDGQFSKGESAVSVALDSHPLDDELRFGFGVLQIAQAIEHLGKGLYKYGAASTNTTLPFLRLPVPENPFPSPISYDALMQLLDQFESDLCRAEATLAQITDAEVKLRLRLGLIKFNFSDLKQNEISLLEILAKLNGERLFFEIANPELRIHFDRGDVAWLRGYCHLLCGIVDGFRAMDLKDELPFYVGNVFPQLKSERVNAFTPAFRFRVANPERLRRMRMHLIEVCRLNPETWMHIRSETDDDYEWLSNPKQTDQLGLPVPDEFVNRWLDMMDQLNGLLEGDCLISSFVGEPMAKANNKKELALNLRKLLDNPPADFLTFSQIVSEWTDERYFESTQNKKKFDARNLFVLIQALQQPFGFAYAARLN